jgi:hypothetical protein
MGWAKLKKMSSTRVFARIQAAERVDPDYIDWEGTVCIHMLDGGTFQVVDFPANDIGPHRRIVEMSLKDGVLLIVTEAAPPPHTPSPKKKRGANNGPPGAPCKRKRRGMA